jgi:hypothetical protein
MSPWIIKGLLFFIFDRTAQDSVCFIDIAGKNTSYDPRGHRQETKKERKTTILTRLD